MSATPYANGGIDPKPLVMPDIRSAKYAIDIKGKPGVGARTSSVTQLGFLLRDLYKENPTNFRLFCPDETNSNRCGAVFETQKRSWMLPLRDFDEALGHDGRVMEVLSEHCCNGWMSAHTHIHTRTPRTGVQLASRRPVFLISCSSVLVLFVAQGGLRSDGSPRYRRDLRGIRHGLRVHDHAGDQVSGKTNNASTQRE